MSGAATNSCGGFELLAEELVNPAVVARHLEAMHQDEQWTEPIHSAPMSKSATSSRGGVELLADNLDDPAVVARHLEVMRQAEQWMKVSCRCP
jgi:hypothetical protein